jgi:hypothetical protein
VRRFVRDIEASRQFVIINTIELEGVTDSAQRDSAPAEGAASTTAPQSSSVSLRLDLAAYFRREASNTGADQQQQQQQQR